MAGMGHDNIGNHPFWSLVLSLIPLSLAVYGTVTGTAVMKKFKGEAHQESSSVLAYARV